MIHRLMCVEEDPENPILECYEESTPDEVAKLFAASKMKAPKMSYVENLTDRPSGLQTVAGINASNSVAFLSRTLGRLGLMEGVDTEKVETLAAHNLPTGIKVSVWELDKRLRTTTASLESKIAFKQSLHRMGMLDTI
jgi:hypothetical protein